jgi:predicted MFS family arabinose efflux permease
MARCRTRSAGDAIVLASLGVSHVASLACALAGNLHSLWLFRTVQGLSRARAWSSDAPSSATRCDGRGSPALMSQITLGLRL